MNILLLGIDVENAFATSAILTNIFNLLAKRDSRIQITSIGWGPSSSENKPFENFKSYFFKNAMHTPFGKVVAKTKAILGVDNILFAWKKLYSLTKNKIDCKTFDIIMGASGHFCYIKAAYELAKKYQKPFIPIYFDPYSKNVSTNARNRDSRHKEESKWNGFAQKILCITDGEGFISNQYQAKTISHPIPIFERPHSAAKTNHIVYGGTFYKGFREPSTLERFLKENFRNDLEFHIYSNVTHFSEDHENVFFHGLVDSRHFSKICEDCLGIIVIGNGKHKGLFPSKLIEAFSFRKPVITINFPDLPEYFKRYPFLIDNFDQLKKITEESLNKVDLRGLFPDRDPEKLIDDIVDCCASATASSK